MLFVGNGKAIDVPSPAATAHWSAEMRKRTWVHVSGSNGAYRRQLAVDAYLHGLGPLAVHNDAQRAGRLRR